jgi:hypothetical protein
MLKQSALVVALATAAVSTSAADVAYPEKFRDAKHVKSMVINNGHPLYNAVGGMHHIYGNAKAIAGYKAGKFGNGSVITFDLFEAVDKDNAVSEGVAQGRGGDGKGQQEVRGHRRLGLPGLRSEDEEGEPRCQGAGGMPRLPRFAKRQGLCLQQPA